jgi:anti-sigma factor RsiW
VSLLSPPPGGASLARSYRNLTEREIRARLDAETLSEIERVTAKAELLRRGAGDDAPDTAFVSGFQPTSAMDIGTVESESEPPVEDAHAPPPAPAPASSRRMWSVMLVLALGIAGGLAWAMHVRAIRL